MMKLQRRIDNLSTGPLLLRWAGQALATYLVVVLVCVLTGTPTLGGKLAFGLWVLVFVVAGFSGSKFRTRNRPRLARR